MEKNTYLEEKKEIEIIEHVDVLVIGGGPAGVGAAIGAAKAGAQTMIVETMGSFGGMWTNGMVITLAGYNNWLRPYQRVVDGVMGEWIDRASKLDGGENNRSWVLNSDPEVMKLVADEMVLEYGVKALLHSWAADVIIEDNVLKGVIIENVEGRKAIMAGAVIDCTGNGDIFARAQESFYISEELQPLTMSFYLAEVNSVGDIPFEDELIIPMGPEPGYLGPNILNDFTSRRRDIHIDRKQLRKAAKNGELPLFGGPWFGGLREKFPWVNTTRIYGSAINAEELTRAEMEGRKNVFAISEYYKKNCPGFENSWIMRTASTIGIRETRQLDGVYKLVGKDILENKQFDDSIALGTWPIDIHPPKGKSGMHDMYVPLPYQIPYRALLPKQLDNLIVAGRCISTDREAMGSMRVGATCGAIGHAAGVAGALASRSGVRPRDLKISLLQDELVKQSGIIALDQAVPATNPLKI